MIDYRASKVPRNKRPKIKMLESCFGWDKGSEFVVAMETDGELYFDDVFRRWSYVEKKDEAKDFEYVRRYV